MDNFKKRSRKLNNITMELMNGYTDGPFWKNHNVMKSEIKWEINEILNLRDSMWFLDEKWKTKITKEENEKFEIISNHKIEIIIATENFFKIMDETKDHDNLTKGILRKPYREALDKAIEADKQRYYIESYDLL